MNRDVLRDLVSILEAGFLRIQSGVSQLWLWVSHAFLIPGEYVLALLVARAPALVEFLGLDVEGYGVIYAASLSAATWVVAFVLVRAGYNLIRDVLESMMYSARRLTVAASHRLRMARLRLAAPIRKIHQRFRGTKSVYLEEFAIDDLQLAILRAQSRLAPGHVITAVDIANEFGVGQLPAQQALDTLRKLHLVEVSFGTIDGFPGYLLTRPGRVFLSADGGSAGS
jgi:hypothetical protein